MASPPIRFPFINGVAYSFASINVTLTCEQTKKSVDLANVGFLSLNYKRERDRGEPGRGGHPDPLFKVRGQNKYTASIKFYKPVSDYIKTEVLGGGGHGDRSFSLTVQFLENGLDTKTDDIRGCTWDSDGSDNGAGTDATQIEVNMSPLKIVFDGEDDVDNPLAAVA